MNQQMISATPKLIKTLGLGEEPMGIFYTDIKPQTETIIHYVSSGIPEHMEGEFYCESPDELRKIFKTVDPRPAPGRYCDELSFSIPFEMFSLMLDRFEDSFLKSKTWKTVQKKISRSNRTWGEE